VADDVLDHASVDILSDDVFAQSVQMSADAIVVGAGLAGLVAAAELVDAGRRVVLVDQEPEA
jgi:heterodisulfide reductase subunit A-like polyferredoxin